MNEIKISYLNYPIYGIGSNEKYVVTSGGGGGKSYGIEDLLDINTFNDKEKKLQALWSTTQQRGVVDSIVYDEKYDIWLGSVRNECLIFQINEETGPNIIHSFVTDFNAKHPRQVVVKFSSISNFILTGGEDKTLKLWKLKIAEHSKGEKKTGTEEEEQRTPSPPPPEVGIVTIGKYKNFFIDTTSNIVEHIGDFKGHEECIKDCDISQDEKIVCTCSADNSLKIWDTHTFVNLHTEQMSNPKQKGDKLNFRCCKFLRNTKRKDDFLYTLLTTAYTSRGNSYLIIWNVHFDDKKEKFTCTKEKFIWLDDRPCCNIAMSLNEKYLALGFSTGALKIYNTNYSLLAHYKKHELPITAMCFIKNDTFLLSAGADYSISCIHINSFSFRYLRRLWKFLFMLIIVMVVCVILLDFFNVGYDLRMRDIIQGKDGMAKGKKKNRKAKSSWSPSSDEL
ncbi:guanine nucleotide-exchange factor SEC12, putative [Plasmodium knowlesi strain H]|uniref:Guanine nucleotide-exchange factor SEC12, putative n=3 Tax=Plasmodium knowlesi TaxID=5850 RepID=A0A5K1UJT1_PLAKH|nr:guanine nucleotide-exchange factor SEC12, putative [Plasmodium knowlesi strain H]OTN65060.1 putative Guanine nucleotide-exchange factor SEC12 [Plasmodium knowlesi]CAA9988188.1 guanine nucleotide-exchange factor SEC12, putative [Plasmodium knowlesi strain H]SBO20104.1 guanine nucleotide-exchange factor SEC12, putative [Plasmodium knowlesi strain H]SBO20678.1 guanine nucleotide-exchange factor SEC12, putative [Plasmodium knowlesi strain H]VVS77662.1 guanine nucleotide-exchange factor SEC12, p|eukprot:XP_002259165.1 hypothetical protein, conserved in Plasmodium species [Plasmodium knowlesi strain H]